MWCIRIKQSLWKFYTKLIEGLEEDYLEVKSDREKEKITDTAVFVLSIFWLG